MYLFSSIKFNISGHEDENLQDPGQSTTMLGLLQYNDDFIKSEGLNQYWLKDDGDGSFDANLNPGGIQRRNFILRNYGNFSFCVSLSHIFGFFEDYDKVLYGTSYELILNRQSNTQALYRSNAGGAAEDDNDGNIFLDKLFWYIPFVNPDNTHKLIYTNNWKIKKLYKWDF